MARPKPKNQFRGLKKVSAAEVKQQKKTEERLDELKKKGRK